jgi:predicted alpha-1,2-mannosidase
MKYPISTILIALLFLLQACSDEELSYTDYVNPFVGTGGHGHTYPGAVMPFGMIQLSPDTRLDGWDGCSGYHYSDDTIFGFSHTALSGTGVSDYGDLLIMPFSGQPCLTNGTIPGDICSYASPFKKKSEVATPGYYGVYLDKPGVKAELTASFRSGIHRYTWSKQTRAGFIIDLNHRDQTFKTELRILNDTTITGCRISSAWAKEQHHYFAIRLSKPFRRFAVEGMPESQAKPASFSDSSGIKAWFGFDAAEGESVIVKVGISSVDEQGALQNLDAEILNLDFEQVKAQGDSIWNHELGKIEVKGGSEEDRKNFYTALYHTMVAPNLWSDVDGRYRGMDMQIHQADSTPQYTVFSLWDTYRTLHPLFTIIDQKRTNEFINTFLRQYEQGGRLPVWELAANETECMIGYHSISVIADAYMKGIRGFDTELALKAMMHSANLDHFGLKAYRDHGFIPADVESESVSKTLEYAYDDWCIAMMAKDMGYDSIYDIFIQRAQYYKNLYDPETGFFRPKINNSFIKPFDPREVNFHLTEANTWQYTFYVPQDISGYIDLLGGQSRFSGMLDELFSAESALLGREQSDITGLIGQYAHGNEPSHHMAYLYAYAGQQHKTANMVRRILREMYSPEPDGLCGNEDCGQMSAWYVMSAMGFYPVCPGSNQYVIGSPAFSEIKIHLENGKEFLIRARANRNGNRYIRKAFSNGEPYNHAFITHEQIMKGGDLRFLMGSTPNEAFGRDEENRPVSAINDRLITPVPYLSHGEQVFFNEQVIRLTHADKNARISWMADPTPENMDPLSAKGAIISNSMNITASARADNRLPSHEIRSGFYKIPENRSIKLKTTYAAQYSAGGDHALIDFLRGSSDFRTGRWQGYHQVDLDATVKLEQEKPLKKITIGFLQDQNSWIFMPVEVIFQTSIDGVSYKTVATQKNSISDRQKGAVVQQFSTPRISQRALYVRIIARNRGECPPWHPGAGQKAWIFADEITIE